MTPDEISSLCCEVKRREGTCNGASEALGAWLGANPCDDDPREARFVASGVGKVPFPSIAGNPPADRARPYYDARFKEQA